MYYQCILAHLVLIAGMTISAEEHLYVPGEPGGPWTMEELLIVKAKLYVLFSNGDGRQSLKELNGRDSSWGGDEPSAPKMLRLGFHDCLKYTDGSGGCDGCLNWEGVGDRKADKNWKYLYEDVKFTNNNGLRPTVEALEGIYTNKDFPFNRAPSLTNSLQQTGKSRADLWAYATLVSVEYAIQTNNMKCDNVPGYPYNVDRSCHHLQGEPGCKIDDLEKRRLRFKYGRIDCISESVDEPYRASKEEIHPNSVGNGRQTIDFYKESFGFNGRETVAIMGAHTLGRLHVSISLFRYVWATKGANFFNNQYYKSIIREDSYFFNDEACNKVTDAWGNKPKVRWVTHVRGDTQNGGPVHWIHEPYVCPNCFDMSKVRGRRDKSCCESKSNAYNNFGQETTLCYPDASRGDNATHHISMDLDPNGGCERYSFVSGLDTMTLPCEIGLYFDFEVTDDGVPYGCPGFEDFKPENWKNKNPLTWSRIDGKKSDPMCERNQLSEPPEANEPLSDIFEEYAQNQTQWIHDFSNTLEKMLENGYGNNELTDAPDHFTGVKCHREWDHASDKYWNCYHEGKIKIDSENCFIPDTTYRGQPVRGIKSYFIEGIDSVEKCQEECVKDPDCNYFTWNSPSFWKGVQRQKCYLKAGIGSIRSKETGCGRKCAGKISGPRSCEREVQYFKIISEVDNQALEGTEDDGKASMSPESSDNGFQLWYLTDVGDQIVNKETGMRLYDGRGKSWKYDDLTKTIVDKRYGQLLGGPNQIWNIMPESA